MQINVVYDSSVTSLQQSNPTLYSDYTNAATAAVNFFDTHLTNNLTYTINFGWGEVGGQAIPANGLGASLAGSYTVAYSDLVTKLQAAYAAVPAGTFSAPIDAAANAILPATDPTNGMGTWSIRSSLAATLGYTNDQLAGLYDSSGKVIAGSVGLSSSAPWFWSQSSPDTTNMLNDATGTFEHEISEILGRVAEGGANNTYTPLDLFRYTAAGNSANAAPGTAVGARSEPFAAGYDANNQTYFSYDGQTVQLPFETPADVASGSDVADWTPATLHDNVADNAPDGADYFSNTDLAVMSVLGYDATNCFLPGTRIATPDGEVPVEQLEAGDLILTLDGAAEAITWIGMAKGFIPRGQRNAATPVVIRKNALAENVPHRDLYVTKGHSLFLDGILVPAEFLINHRSIAWDDRAGEVTVYHIELPRHAVLLANGAAAETYRDDGNVALFQNAQSRPRFPNQTACAPVLTGGAQVDAIWQRLLDRSGFRGAPGLTAEPDLHLVVNGRRVDGTVGFHGGYSFPINYFGGDVHIASRAAAPDRLGIGRDCRLLGVGLKRIVIWRGALPTIIEMDDVRLSHGFHQHEAGNDYRWTNGDGLLTADLLDETVKAIDIFIGGSTQYEDVQLLARSA